MTTWSTPQSLFDKLNAEFHFTLDACANTENAKCPRYFTTRESCIACGGTGVLVGPELDKCHLCDSLSQYWSGSIWMNPPYGREIGEWLRKAVSASLEGHTVVALVPTRTNAPWWHDWAMMADEIRFIRKKLAFVSDNGKTGVPFTGHAVLVFAGNRNGTPKVISMDQAEIRSGSANLSDNSK